MNYEIKTETVAGQPVAAARQRTFTVIGATIRPSCARMFCIS
jgi:hypothetical protein